MVLQLPSARTRRRSAPKRRRVSIGSSSRTLASRAERRRALSARLDLFRRGYCRAPRATTAHVLRKVACRGCRERIWLFALPRRDRGKIGIAIDGLFAHVLPAIEQEYGER